MRKTLLEVCTAVWGLAIAISLVPVWTRPAPPDQQVGFARSIGLDARGPLLFAIGLILLPILTKSVMRPVIQRLTDGLPWARAAAASAMVVGLWFAIITKDVAWVIVPAAAVIATATLLRSRNLGFTRHDAILVPVVLAVYVAVLDAARDLPIDKVFVIAAVLVFAVRIAVAMIAAPASEAVRPAFAFLAAPLALALQTPFFRYDQRHSPWLPLFLTLVTPFILRLTLRREAWPRRLLIWVVYPLAVYSYVHVASLLGAEGKPRVIMFEDAQGLTPASQMLRGERAYRDVLPVHGLLEDGFLDYLALRFRSDVNMGHALKARTVIRALDAVAVYAIATAMTASPEVGLLTSLFTISMNASQGIRLVPALATLALIAVAVRCRRPRLFLWAGAGIVLCGLTSLEFAAYAFVSLIVALVRQRNAVAWRSAVLGSLVAGVLLLAILLILGIAGDFVHSTFIEVPTMGAAYTLDIFHAPEGFKRYRHVPEILVAFFERTSTIYVLWCGAAIFVAVMITRRASRRMEPAVILALFIVLSAISYAERHHVFRASPTIFAVVLTWFLVRRRSPFAAPAIAALLILALPTTHLAIVGSLRRHRGPVESGWTEIRDIPRARGALFPEKDALVVTTAARYISRLPPGETFFDFTNRGLLYFLFDRDNPVRQTEVAFYQVEERQREVIARLKANPRVRVALVPDGLTDGTGVDGIANQLRAPLVWSYLEQNFEPDFKENGVVFWRRR